MRKVKIRASKMVIMEVKAVRLDTPLQLFVSLMVITYIHTIVSHSYQKKTSLRTTTISYYNNSTVKKYICIHQLALFDPCTPANTPYVHHYHYHCLNNTCVPASTSICAPVDTNIL